MIAKTIKKISKNNSIIPMIKYNSIQAALYWLVFLLSLIIFLCASQGIVATWQISLPQPSPMSLGTVLIYTFAVSSLYNVFISQKIGRFISKSLPNQTSLRQYLKYRQYFALARLFDNSLFWLFAAYSLAKIYGFYQTKPFWFSWKTWIICFFYLQLQQYIHKIIINKPKSIK